VLEPKQEQAVTAEAGDRRNPAAHRQKLPDHTGISNSIAGSSSSSFIAVMAGSDSEEIAGSEAITQLAIDRTDPRLVGSG
jgi:hypothetical protein